ncbi:hypothetical protein DPEC_G00342060 [Dallia pectoralis]|uniref:Uncharacterized protein n=1 Tax=Dallia pectoralis TaxID=75939 RepID=A0ACC2F5L6_DALPE|nr:hypothetical protein DPEC_G00342060 [Dallia pectoralis]
MATPSCKQAAASRPLSYISGGMYKGSTVLYTRPVLTESAVRVVPFYPQPGMAVTPGSVSTPASCPPRRISDGVCLGTTFSDTHAVSAGTAGSTFLSSPFPDEDRVEERIDSRVVRQRQHSLKAEGGGALKFPSPLATRKAEESGQSGLMQSLRLHGQSALSEITRPVSGVDRVITGSTPIAGVPHLSMGDSSSAHHTTSSGFSRAESAGGSSDVTAGLGFHRPPSLLSEVSPSFSSSTVEKSVIANPFRGSLPMGCTSATDGQVSGGESENRLQYFSSKLSPTSRTPALRALLGVASELFPVYVARSNNKEKLYGTVSLRSTSLLGSGGDGDKIRGESDSPAVGNSESQREGRYRHCPTGPEREGVGTGNLLELETVQLVLTHFAPRLRGRDVLIRSDNRATVAYINRQGGVRSPVLHEAATRLWLWAHRHLRSLSAVHVPGRQNVGADLMSRGGPRDDDWRLNPEIVSLIWERFGEARADLFAARENVQCRLWFSLRALDGPPLGTDAWSMFVRWCETNTMDPVCCPVEQILSFLQYLFDKRRSASTIKGYAAAISACHEGFGNKTVFSHSLVKRFLTGTRRLRPVARASVPQWDLSTVLNALCEPPFEPLSQISLRLLSLKTALLLALCSTKRLAPLFTVVSSASPGYHQLLAQIRSLTSRSNEGSTELRHKKLKQKH